MNSFLDIVKKIPLLFESLFVTIVPSAEQVFAETFVNENRDKELNVASMSSMYDVSSGDSIVKINNMSDFTLKVCNQNVSIDDYDLLKEEMNEAIKEYEDEKARIENGALSSNTASSFVLSDCVGGDVYSIAESLVGMGGTCFYICQLFIYNYTGQWCSFGDVVQTDSPEPGDLIYYADGGVGYEHWAVYLGGESALHGNYNGTTIIGSVYLKHGSSPIFYKIA